MISVTLYQPLRPPQDVPAEGFGALDSAAGFARVPELVSSMLGCSPKLVDVLASGERYVAYSIFDYQGEVNFEAMTVMADLTGQSFDLANDDEVLLGPILLVRR